nr:MAG TPA: hypothetical protein [Caudoviricetes sp.]
MNKYEYDLRLNYYKDRIDVFKEDIKQGNKRWSKAYCLHAIEESKKRIEELKNVGFTLEDR